MANMELNAVKKYNSITRNSFLLADERTRWKQLTNTQVYRRQGLYLRSIGTGKSKNRETKSAQFRIATSGRGFETVEIAFHEE